MEVKEEKKVAILKTVCSPLMKTLEKKKRTTLLLLDTVADFYKNAEEFELFKQMISGFVKYMIAADEKITSVFNLIKI